MRGLGPARAETELTLRDQPGVELPHRSEGFGPCFCVA